MERRNKSNEVVAKNKIVNLINILYNDGGCNHSKKVIRIMEEIIKSHVLDFRNNQKLTKIDRWNIYQPDSLHIVYIYSDLKNDQLISSEVVCHISEFLNRWRHLKLDELGI